MADISTTLAKLRVIRDKRDLTLKRTSPYLRTTFIGADGLERPVVLRYYQIQMIAHLLVMQHFVVGDDTGLGKTLIAISALAHSWVALPNLPQNALVLTKKSAVRQWAREFERFTTGIKVFVCRGTPKERDAIRGEFDAFQGPKVLIMGYRSIIKDFAKMQERRWGVFIADEASIFKNPRAQIHQMCRHLSGQSERVWALTATLLTVRLIDGWGIYRVVKPGLFTHGTEAAFIKDYCVWEQKDVGRGRRVVVVKGYTRAALTRFKEVIEPYYLGRAKHEVASELPPLTTREIRVGLSPEQTAKYNETLTGFLDVGGVEKEITPLTAITYCQEIVNHPELVGVEGGSAKLDALVDLLTEGDLEDQKVIVFTRFEKMVGIGTKALEKVGIKCVRITGKEDEDERQAAMDTFQDLKSDVKVVWITTAGSDAINLQAAKAIIFYDTPWGGTFIQVLGRMIRIGSLHDRCFAIHLIADGTIDEHTLLLRDKRLALIEAVLGKRIRGEEMSVDDLGNVTSDVLDLFDRLRKDAGRKVSGGDYIDA